MTPGLTFSPLARRDLIEIGDHIARDSQAKARALVDRLIQQCEKIRLAPLGYVGREDLEPGLRMAALGRYVIFFRLVEAGIRIERILHGARNLPNLFRADAGPPR